MILVEARFCNKSSLVEESKRNTEKARWRTPRGWEGVNSCEAFLDSEPMMESVGERTRTVSRIMKSPWVMVFPSHF